jgi:hypothetical protein
VKKSRVAAITAIGLLVQIPAHAQQQVANTNSEQAPATFASPDDVRHLVVLNKQGPNFEERREFPDELRAHRQIYLDLTASGHILASGVLRSDPAMGFVLFRAGVDEQWVRERLTADFVIERGILELEFIYWEIQMGGFGGESPPQDP